MKALFIGGTGTISTDVTRLCTEKGWEVTLLNRGTRNREMPPGVICLKADVEDRQAVEECLRGKNFDVVVNFIAYTPPQVMRDIEVFAGRTSQYIFISSASCYDASGEPVITESRRLHNPHWQYSRDKIACEALLIDAYREKDFPVTIVRPSHTYSDRSLPLILHGEQGHWQTLDRMRRGKPVLLPGDGTSLWCVTHSADFAIAFEGLMGRPETLGEAYHITSDESLSWNLIYQEIAAALGVPAKLLHISTDMLTRHTPSCAPGLYGDKIHSVLFDNTKIKRLVPWYQAKIPFSRGVRGTVETFLSDRSLQTPDQAFESWCDELVQKIERF